METKGDVWLRVEREGTLCCTCKYRYTYSLGHNTVRECHAQQADYCRGVKEWELTQMEIMDASLP